MSRQEVDEYLATLSEPKRSTLEELRRTIVEIVPDAEQCISYGMPAFRVRGKVVAGFAAFKNHLSYLPHSGSVLSELADDLAGYTQELGCPDAVRVGLRTVHDPGGLVGELVPS